MYVVPSQARVRPTSGRWSAQRSGSAGRARASARHWLTRCRSTRPGSSTGPRRRQLGVENVYLDLCDPLTWPAVEASFAAGLAEGIDRAIFIHNAVHPGGSGMVVDTGSDEFGTAVLANVAAPLVLAGAFARHCPAEVDARVALVSSNAAGCPVSRRICRPRRQGGDRALGQGGAARNRARSAVRAIGDGDPPGTRRHPGGPADGRPRSSRATPRRQEPRGATAGRRWRPDRGRSADVGGDPRHRGG